MEKVIDDHWSIMGKFDRGASHEVRDRRMGRVVSAGRGDRRRLHPEPADHAARRRAHGHDFDIFNRHADKIAMANVAQTINCIHSLFLAMEDKFTRTPVYHVFDMYRGHMGARLVPVKIQAPELNAHGAAGCRGRLRFASAG